MKQFLILSALFLSFLGSASAGLFEDIERPVDEGKSDNNPTVY